MLRVKLTSSFSVRHENVSDAIVVNFTDPY